METRIANAPIPDMNKIPESVMLRSESAAISNPGGASAIKASQQAKAARLALLLR